MKFLLIALSLSLSPLAISGEYQIDRYQTKAENKVTNCVNENAEIRTEHRNPKKTALEKKAFLYHAVERIVK